MEALEGSGAPFPAWPFRVALWLPESPVRMARILAATLRREGLSQPCSVVPGRGSSWALGAAGLQQGLLWKAATAAALVRVERGPGPFALLSQPFRRGRERGRSLSLLLPQWKPQDGRQQAKLQRDPPGDLRLVGLWVCSQQGVRPSPLWLSRCEVGQEAAERAPLPVKVLTRSLFEAEQ